MIIKSFLLLLLAIFALAASSTTSSGSVFSVTNKALDSCLANSRSLACKIPGVTNTKLCLRAKKKASDYYAASKRSWLSSAAKLRYLKLAREAIAQGNRVPRCKVSLPRTW